MTRIEKRFAALAEARRKAFVAFVMAGDPDYDTSLAVLRGLPAAGVDVIEIGMPFTDPMADGPAIQRAGQRALDGGQTMDRTLAMVRAFREADDATPIVLMGYYNPIYSRGVAALPRRGEGGRRRRADRRRPAARGGRRALPARPGRGPELHPPRHADDRRPPAAAGAHQHLGLRLLRLDHRHHRRRPPPAPPPSAPRSPASRRGPPLPVCVGFGIRTPARRRARSPRVADGAVVGSAIVERIGAGEPPAAVLAFVRTLAEGAHR